MVSVKRIPQQHAGMPAKESSMDIVDFLIHIHPDLPIEQRAKLEEALGLLEALYRLISALNNRMNLLWPMILR